MKTFATLTSLLVLLSMQSAVGDVLTVQLTGGNEVPPVNSSVTGTATIELIADGTIEYFVSLSNPDGVELLGVAGAHIHCGAIGANGMVVAVLSPPVMGGRNESMVVLDGVLNDDSIVNVACGATIAQLYASIIAGGTYVNVHSTENMSGEVRGQTPKVMVPVDDMSGGNEVPAVTSSVTGTATIELIADGTIEYSVNLTNPEGVALLGAGGAHIHCGAIGANGMVVAVLSPPVMGGRNESMVVLDGVLNVSSIVNVACGSTIAEFSASIIAGGTYINVHSSDNPSGEVRGQILGFIPAATGAPTKAPTDAPSASPVGANGDPHFSTWKGEHYDYHGKCDLELVSDPLFANGKGLDVHIRTEILRQWSYIKHGAIRIGNDILEVKGGADENHYWFNKVYQGELTTLGGFPVKYKKANSKQHVYTIDLGNNEEIVISTFKDFVRIDFKEPKKSLYGNTVGLLADFNTGKKLGRDGFTTIEDYNDFGQEWQVLADGPKLFHEVSGRQFPGQKCVLPSELHAEEKRRRGEVKRIGGGTPNTITDTMAELACAKVSVAERESCVSDVLITGDVDMAGAY
jgi:hypothetical protein